MLLLTFLFFLVLVHGSWGKWSDFTNCDATCGGGKQARSRLCNNPSPSNGGSDCLLSDGNGVREKLEYDIQICNSNVCPGIIVLKYL